VKGVVADTSEWIEHLAGRPAPVFEQCLESRAIIVPLITVTELTSGARTREEFMVIEDLFEGLPHHEPTFYYFSRAGELRRLMRGKGLSVSPSDALVAQCALDRDAPLLTRDAVFWKIAAHTKLRLASALP
jgi:predicted nucleic acid-binding protein